MSRLASLIAIVPLLAILGLGTLERTYAPPRGTEPVGPVYGSHILRQPFSPPEVLTAIDVRLATYARRNDGVVTLRLRKPGSTEDLRVASVAAEEIHDSALHRFRFAPLRVGDVAPPSEWTGAPFPLELTIESTAADEGNAIAVWAREDPDQVWIPQWSASGPMPGIATYDGVDLKRNLVFAPVAVLSATEAAAGVLGRGASGGLPALVGFLVLMLPGLLLSRLLLPSERPLVAIAAAPAFGIAFVGIVTLWAGTLGLSIGWVTPALVAVGSVVGLVVMERGRWRQSARHELRTSLAAESWVGAAVLGALGLGLIARAIALDGLATPPGADTYHHALITQLILDRGGVPADYRPYAPIDSFAYHFGFHATAAWMAALVGWNGLQAVQAAGPLLNCLAALSVFALAMLARLGPVAAVVAALVTALVSPFPAWFLDVGRYPQEAALVVFPVAVAFVLGYPGRCPGKVRAAPEGSALGRFAVWRDLDKVEWRSIVGGAILAAGLFLSHYRVVLMLLVLMALYLAWTVVTSRWKGDRAVALAFARCAGITLGAVVLVAPWIARLAQAFTLGIRGSEGRYAPDYFDFARLGTALHHPALGPLVALTLVGITVAIVTRAPLVALLGAWGLLLIVASNPRWLPIPGAGALDSVTVVSSLYVVVTVAVGSLAQRIWDGPRRAHQAALTTVARPMLIAGMAAAVGWGALQLPSLVQPEQSLAGPGDLVAAQWIDTHVPRDGRLLVNASVVHWEPDFVEPTDGGSWLPLLAHRKTTLLPLVYAGERGVAPGEIERMERIANAARADVAAPGTVALLREAGVTHVYLGVYGGPIDELRLAGSPSFRRVYNAGGVSIYELVGSART